MLSTTVKIFILVYSLLLAWGCACHPKHQIDNNVDAHLAFPFETLPSPVPDGASDLRPTSLPDGNLLLSWWVQSSKIQPSLFFSVWKNRQWTKPDVVTDMANVIDAHVIATDDNALAALWMAAKTIKNNAGEVQEIYISRKKSLESQQWTAPFLLSQETETSVKQYPAITAMPNGELLAAWMDMRNYKIIPPQKPGEEAKSEGYGSLITAKVSADSKHVTESLVTTKFCGCCPLAMSTSGQTGLLAYRGDQRKRARPKTNQD